MKRVVIRAEFVTDNVFNEGFICIHENAGKKIFEGVKNNIDATFKNLEIIRP